MRCSQIICENASGERYTSGPHLSEYLYLWVRYNSRRGCRVLYIVNIKPKVK